MKKEDTITAAHLIQAAKLGNSKADNIVRTGKNTNLRLKSLLEYWLVVNIATVVASSLFASVIKQYQK